MNVTTISEELRMMHRIQVKPLMTVTSIITTTIHSSPPAPKDNTEDTTT